MQVSLWPPSGTMYHVLWMLVCCNARRVKTSDKNQLWREQLTAASYNFRIWLGGTSSSLAPDMNKIGVVISLMLSIDFHPMRRIKPLKVARNCKMP